ncbi:MAG: molybdopterin-binding protein [Thermoplasmataceae archaeon]
MHSAVVIGIGNELLNGYTLNSNLKDISQELTLIGYTVKRGLVVRDDPSEISWALSVGMESDLVVTTGGLGPTFDDITSSSVASHLGLGYVENKEARKLLEVWYSSINEEMTEDRLKMAMMPEGATAVTNKEGAAPGILLRRGDTTILSLPGVPREALAMLKSVRDSISVPDVVNMERIYTINGGMESRIAPVIRKAMKQMDGKAYIKSHPEESEAGKPGITLQITSSGPDSGTVQRNLDDAQKILGQLLLEMGHVMLLT